MTRKAVKLQYAPYTTVRRRCQISRIRLKLSPEAVWEE
ncbi:hypothetical protein [Escherichia phage EP_H11]|nr:hypothetical protein [Escherichia phage EP_H11]